MARCSFSRLRCTIARVGHHAPVLTLLMVACSEDGENAKPDAGCESRAVDATRGAVDPALLWSHHVADGQGPSHYNVSLGFQGRYVFSGAPDGGGTMFAVDAGPSPLWKIVVAGGFLVAASATDDVFYGVRMNNGVGAAVHRFRAADAQPVWTYDAALQGFTFADVGLLMGGNSPVATTPDGHVLAVAANSADKLAILFFGVESPTPLGVYRGEEPASVLGTIWLKLTPDGRECMYQADGRFQRVDVATQQVVSSVQMPDVRAVSPDGTLLVRGSTNLLRAYRRIADSYDEQILVEYPQTIAEGTSIFPEAAAVAADNDTVVAVWSREDHRQLTVTAFSLSCGRNPIWAYTLANSEGRLQDLAAAVKISNDSAWVAAGTWGGEDNSHPEFLLFESADPSEPRFVFDTDGSVLALDMTPDGSVIAGGTKATHTNIVGSGGGVFVVSTMQ